MPTNRATGAIRVSLLVAAVAVAVCAVLGFTIVASPRWSSTEVAAVVWLHGIRNPFFDVVALTINSVFGPSGAVVVTLITLAWVLFGSRSWCVTLRVGIVLGVPWAVAEILKAVVQRPRPDPALLQPMIVADSATYSYPSGHAAFVAALSCALLLVALRGRTRAWGISAGVLVVVLTAWSRVYLGVHYVTDVLASALLVPVVALATAKVLAAWPQLSAK